MKKSHLLLLLLIVPISSVIAQVTSDPEVIYIGSQDEFKIIFDATKGEGGMKGQSSCYIHTGVITDKSKDDTDWKHATTWKDNSDKYKMTKVEGKSNVWEITITGGINSYYGITSAERVLKLAFVFRTSTASKQTENLYYELTDPCEIVYPNSGDLLFTGEKQEFIAIAHGGADSLCLKLINGSDTRVYSKLKADTIVIDTTLVNTGSYKMEFEVYNDDKLTASRSVTFTAKVPPEKKPLPEYLQEGINYLPNGRVGLVLRAPGKASVSIIGDFNDWDTTDADYAMYLDSIWFWKEFTLPNDVETGKPDTTRMYGFQYYVDGKIKVSDPYAQWVLDPNRDNDIRDRMDSNLPSLPTRGKYDGLVSVLCHTYPDQYQWQWDGYAKPDKKDLVIYELCIRDFVSKTRTSTGGRPGTSVGSLAEVTEKLDYLQGLGINAIELMPVTEFDNNDSWGYDPNHDFAADKAYGTTNEYKAFIDECHRRGIAVILDMVFNHVTGQHPWAKLYWNAGGSKPAANNPWLNQEAPHPWSVFNDVNHEYDGTRLYFDRCLQYWIKEYHVDGFRMDLAKGFSQRKCTESTCANYDASRVKILKEYCSAAFEANPKAYFILEYFVDNSEEKAMSNFGALPWRNMNYNYRQAADGNNAGFTDSATKGGMFENGWVGYAESHDEERCGFEMLKYGKGNLKTNEEARLLRVPTVMAFATLIPGPKMIWEFMEMGYDISIDDGGNTGRKPVPWSEGYKPLHYDENASRMAAYQKCAKVINLRKFYPQLFRSDVVTTNCNVQVVTTPKRIDSHWVNPDNSNEEIYTIVLGNFNAANSLTFDGKFPVTGTWYNYMTGEPVNVTRKNMYLTMQPGELLILSTSKFDVPVDAPNVISDADSNDISVYPTETDGFVYVQSKDVPESIHVFDVAGNLLKSVDKTSQVSLADCHRGRLLVMVTTADDTKGFVIFKR